MTRPRIPTRSRLLIVALAASTAAMAAACGTGTPPRSGGTETGPPTAATSVPAPAATSPGGPGATAPSLPGGWKLCANEAQRYEIGYPGGWYTASLRPEEVCSQFHPSAFSVPPYSEYPLTALNARQTPESFPGGQSDPASVRSLLREETTIGGRRAVRFEEEFTGSGLYEPGTRRYGYTIDRDGRAFVVFAMARPGTPGYPDWKAVVDRAVETLRFR